LERSVFSDRRAWATWARALRSTSCPRRESSPQPAEGAPRQLRQERYNSLWASRARCRGGGSHLADVPNGSLGRPAPAASQTGGEAGCRGRRSVLFAEAGGFVDMPIYTHAALAAGQSIGGPTIVEQRESKVVIYPSQTASVDDYLDMVISLQRSGV